MKRIMAFLLSVCLVAGILSLASTPASAAQVSEAVISERIDELYSKLGGKYFNTNNGTICGAKHSNHGCSQCLVSNVIQAQWFKGLFGSISSSQLSGIGNSCMGFVRFATWYIFRADDSDSVRSELLGTNLNFDYETVSKRVRVGDYLWLNSMGHAVIFISCDRNGIEVLHCNYTGEYNCKVTKDKIRYGGTFGHCRMYSLKNKEADSGTEERKLSISVSNGEYPSGTLFQGSSFPLGGEISSGNMITYFGGQIIDKASGRVCMAKEQTASTKKIAIRRSKVDMGLNFNELPVGTYYLQYTAKDAAGTTAQWKSEPFQIVSSENRCSHSYQTVKKNDGTYTAVCKTCKEEYVISGVDTATAGTYVVVSDSAYLRAYPYQESPANTMPKGTELPVVGSVRNAYDNLWYRLADGWWVYSERVKLVQKGAKVANGVYTLTPECAPGFCLDVAGGNGTDGANIQIYTANGSDAQQFRFNNAEDGYFTITAVCSGKLLDVKNARKSSGTNVQQWKENGNAAQKWMLEDAGNGYYYIVPKLNTNLCLDVSNAEAKNGANVQVWAKNGSNAQRWILTGVKDSGNTETVGWGPWSSWSANAVSSTNTRQVETRQVKVSSGNTEYRYGRYVSNGHDCWCGTYLANRPYSNGSVSMDYSPWSTTRYGVYDSGWTCGECGGNHAGFYATDAAGIEYWHEYKVNGQSYYWEETRSGGESYRTEYRYRDMIQS